MSPVIHIVLLTFKSDISPESVKKVCFPNSHPFKKCVTATRLQLTAPSSNKSVEELLSLRETCLGPTTGRPYMLSIKGGKDSSFHLPGGKYVSALS